MVMGLELELWHQGLGKGGQNEAENVRPDFEERSWRASAVGIKIVIWYNDVLQVGGSGCKDGREKKPSGIKITSSLSRDPKTNLL